MIRPSATRVLLLSAGLLLLAGTAPAHAQTSIGTDRGVEVQGFRPGTGRYDLFTVETSRLPESGLSSLGLFYNYALDPLVLRRNGQVIERVVSDLQTANLFASFVLANLVEVGFDVPVHVRMDGRGGAVLGLPGDLDTSAVGDLRVDLKWRLLGKGHRGFGLAALTPVTLPLGRGIRFHGDSGATVALGLVADYGWERVRLAAKLGYLFRNEAHFGNLAFDDELFYGVGVGVAVAQGRVPVELIAEARGSTSSSSPFKALNQNPMEALLGLRVGIPDTGFDLFAGAGVGLQSGYGVPTARAFAGLRWHFDAPRPAAPATPPPPCPMCEKCADCEKCKVCEKCPDCPEKTCPACEQKPCPEAPACPTTPKCPEPPKAEPPKPAPLAVRLRHVYFLTDRYDPRKDSEPSLNRLVEFLKKYPTLTIRVEGHTDSVGNQRYNRQLSQNRANGVRKYLVGQGIDQGRVEAKGFGPARPVSTNKTAKGRQENRRVEVHFTSEVPAELRLQIERTEF